MGYKQLSHVKSKISKNTGRGGEGRGGKLLKKM